MTDSDSLLKFCDSFVEQQARINKLTAKNLFQLDGTNNNFGIIGSEGDNSQLFQYKWIVWCYNRDSSLFPHQQKKNGRVLGPVRNHYNEMV